MGKPPLEYELFAIRYSTREASRAHNFVDGDPNDAPMPMDYFSWLARSGDLVFAIDTGFSREMAAKRNRAFLRCPAESLRLLGVDPDEVADVVVTHMHNDHIGNLAKFPKARFHLHEREMAYATGKHMRYAVGRRGYDVDSVMEMVRLNYEGRVVFHSSMAELAPGLSIHPTGGHADGLQFVRAWTRRGWVVIASDVTHYYENLETNRPYPLAFHLGDMLEGFRAVERAATSRDHIIPGHDPLVMRRYPAANPATEGAIVRLD
jgi:glyoxylase-like metal-dependent hydrolase (beta-lactamase superfamily II)